MNVVDNAGLGVQAIQCQKTANTQTQTLERSLQVLVIGLQSEKVWAETAEIADSSTAFFVKEERILVVVLLVLVSSIR